MDKFMQEDEFLKSVDYIQLHDTEEVLFPIHVDKLIQLEPHQEHAGYLV